MKMYQWEEAIETLNQIEKRSSKKGGQADGRAMKRESSPLQAVLSRDARLLYGVCVCVCACLREYDSLLHLVVQIVHERVALQELVKRPAVCGHDGADGPGLGCESIGAAVQLNGCAWRNGRQRRRPH